MSLKTYLRTIVRKWLEIVDPPQELPVVEEAAKRGISINAELLRRSGERVVQRKVCAPTLPPGVWPSDFTYNATDDPAGLGAPVAMDSESIAPMFAFANSVNCGLGFPGYPYLAELSQRSEYRSATETMASEMTREFIVLTVNGKRRKRRDKKPAAGPIGTATDAAGDDDQTDEAASAGDENDPLQDKLEQIDQALKDFKVCELFRKMAEYDGFYGRGQMYVDIDHGSDTDHTRQLPLLIDEETIPKGALKGFKPIEPLWTTPYTYNANDALAADFYVPKAWFVLGKRVHASRLLTFIGREVPDMLKPAYNFGGLSMTQLMESYVYAWLQTRNSIRDLIHNFSVMCLQTDMTNILKGEADPANGGLMARAQLFVQNRDNQGVFLLDKDKEELTAVNVPLAGLSDLQAQAQEQMSAPSHIPPVKFSGISPAGLNASSEGEIKVFYDFVRAFQQVLFGPHLTSVLKILQLHLFGQIDDSIGFEFIPLWMPTVAELADIRKADSEAAGTLIDKGVVAPEEVREKMAADPDSGYNNLSGPPPNPPSLEEMTASHDLGEESAASAHQRSMQVEKLKGKKAA